MTSPSMTPPADNTAAAEGAPLTPPKNTEANRRDLAWTMIQSAIESDDQEPLYELLADYFCAAWEKSDADFQVCWLSAHDE